jgi:hypothetical protein
MKGFSAMSPKKLATSTKSNALDISKITGTKKSRKGVQPLSNFIPVDEAVQMSSLVGETMFIVKLEPTQSDQYGEGFNVWYKETPTSKETLHAYTYGTMTVPILKMVYEQTNKGERISLDSPVRATVQQAGRGVTLV